MNGLDGRDGRDSRPVPDPTTQTAQLVDKAIAALRELIEARLTEIDKDVTQLQADIRQRPHDIEVQIRQLEALFGERFSTVAEQFTGVQTQFGERDVRVRDAALANTTAINAALQSQKEAAGEQAKSFTLSIDKSEKGTLEQISQQRELLKTTTDSLKENVADIKDRLTRIESIATARVTEKSESHAGNSWVLALVMGAVGIIGLVVTLAVLFGK